MIQEARVVHLRSRKKLPRQYSHWGASDFIEQNVFHYLFSVIRTPGWVLLGSWPLIQRTETKASQIIKRRVIAIQRKGAEHLIEGHTAKIGSRPHECEHSRAQLLFEFPLMEFKGRRSQGVSLDFD